MKTISIQLESLPFLGEFNKAVLTNLPQADVLCIQNTSNSYFPKLRELQMKEKPSNIELSFLLKTYSQKYFSSFGYVEDDRARFDVGVTTLVSYYNRVLKCSERDVRVVQYRGFSLTTKVLIVDFENIETGLRYVAENYFDILDC